MIDEGLIIMAVGMMAVFAFLIVMVLAMRFMSGFVVRNFPESEESAHRGPGAGDAGRLKAAGASEAAGRAARGDEADEAEIAAAVAGTFAAVGTGEAEIAAAVAGAFAAAGAGEAEIAAAAAAARMCC